jgi:hypothetical protein
LGIIRRLTDTERAIEISIVWGIRGEGDWEDEKDVSRRRESVDGEGRMGEGWRSGVAWLVVVVVVAGFVDWVEV